MAPTIRPIRSDCPGQDYAVDFYRDELVVTVTSSPSEISRWIHDVLFHNRSYSSHPLVVGVGVYWTPYSASSDPSPDSYRSNVPTDSYYADPQPYNYRSDPPADTLQLCVGKRCLIIKLSHCDRVPDVLRSFLTDTQITFAGVWNSQDARKLELSRHRLEIGELLDIRKFVVYGLRGSSFQKIAEVRLGCCDGVRLDNEISMSDWSVYNLSNEQILQASVEAHVCFLLGVKDRLWEVTS